MKEVSFTIQGKIHRMDVSELREFIRHLTTLAVEAEQEPETALLPPTLNPDGMLDLESIRLFLSQLNADPAWLRNNASRLWAQLGKLSAHDLLPFDVLCSHCGRSVREVCPVGKWYHLQGDARCYVMTPETMLKYGPRVLCDPTTRLGPKTRKHLQILVDSLQARKDGREA